MLKARNPQSVAKQIDAMFEKINSYEFAKAKNDLNWQKEEEVLKTIFSPFLSKA